jgi:hypothetical protein
MNYLSNMDATKSAIDPSWRYAYSGPDANLRRLASTSLGLGNILAIEPPAVNTSWSTTFWCPDLQCDGVTGSK